MLMGWLEEEGNPSFRSGVLFGVTKCCISWAM